MASFFNTPTGGTNDPNGLGFYDRNLKRPNARPTALAYQALVEKEKEDKDKDKDKDKKIPTAGVNTAATPETAAAPANNNYLDKYFSILNASNKAAEDAIYNAYTNAIGVADRNFEASRNQANKNFYNAERYLNQLYGGDVSGVGLSNRARLAQTRANSLADIEQTRQNAYQNALSERNNALANTKTNYGNKVADMAKYGLTYNGDIDDTSYLKYLQALGLGR